MLTIEESLKVVRRNQRCWQVGIFYLLCFIASGVIALDTSLIYAQDQHAFLSDEDLDSVNLYKQLQKAAYRAADKRLEKIADLNDPLSIRDYQKSQRRKMTERLGGFPEKSPLHDTVVGVLHADGYRIEKVIFDSRPHHRVTANLYLPDGANAVERIPGIVVSSGHSRTAKTADYNQRFGAMFATHGMAALVFDPIGQGERSQILNSDGGVAHVGTTTEHMLIGVGATLVGKNTATYRVWDGMRAIDYLISRPEIDHERIGYTGCSGGGTLTSYVMALDSRVHCAAPACYLTTFRRLIETIGPQDAEQNIYSQLADGLDQPDYVFMRAPQPTLISSTTEDFFDIHGSWENFRQSKQIYGRLGYPERVDLVEIEGAHGVQPEGLATITHWMKRWLCGVDQPVEPAELTLQDPADLLCTSTGQVLTQFTDELSIVDLNSKIAQELAAARSDVWNRLSAAKQRERVREVMKCRAFNAEGAKFLQRARLDSAYGKMSCGILSSESRQIPVAWIQASQPSSQWSVVMDDQGIDGGKNLSSVIEDRLRSGKNVMFLDLAGQGSTTSSKPDATLTDWKTFYLAYLLGYSMVGLQTQDLNITRDYLLTKSLLPNGEVPADFSIELIASGHSGIVALHAAAVDDHHLSEVKLSDLPPSWDSVVKMHAPAGMLSSTIHGVLESYDWPDLIRLIGEDRVEIATE